MSEGQCCLCKDGIRLSYEYRIIYIVLLLFQHCRITCCSFSEFKETYLILLIMFFVTKAMVIR